MDALVDFTPKADWQWVFNEEENFLKVLMTNCEIKLAYKPRMLVLEFVSPLYFTLEDVINYNALLETLPLASFSEALSHTIILHVLAIGLFHKPIMPQGWLFESSESPLKEIKEGHIYSLKSKKMDSNGNYLLVELSDEFALCLLLDKQHDLSSRKSLQQFHVVKVTIDQLNPMWHEGQKSWTSYQIG